MKKINHLCDWDLFEKDVRKHIKNTLSGHYHSPHQINRIEPIDFIADFFGDDFLYSNIIKYVCRFKTMGNKEDLLKTAHYLSILYNLPKHTY